MRIKKFILILAVFCLVLPSVLTVNAATATKPKKSYEIAVVFDNSGSMYNSEAWCRAKYAMEIFASMLNYEGGDKLRIYPMWEVTTDGSTPGSGGSYAAIEINSKNDIDKISRLYTVAPDQTPFEPIYEAHDYLAKESQANEKWLIVLTDGAFNQEKRGDTIGEISENQLQTMFERVADNGIKVQYLGFGSAASLKSRSDIGFFAKNSTDKSLKDDLINICNSIFQRIELPESRLNGKTLDLDISMSNIVVFVQGQDVKINSLKDESGKAVSVTLGSGQRRYSEFSTSSVYAAPVDRTLGGQVVTFGACPKGKYTLDFSGAETIQIFYEPDVDIRVNIKNDDGIGIDPSSGELPAGKYTVSSTIVDRVTGEDVSKHELMGSNVVLNTFIKQSGDADYKKCENGASFTLLPDETTEIYIEGTYLTDYKISTKDDPSAFPIKWKIKEILVDFRAKAEVTQPDGRYVIQTHDEWQPIKVGLTLEGQPLTAEQMASTSVTAEAEGMRFRCEPVPGESAYYVYIDGDADGNFESIVPGEHEIKITCGYKGDYEAEGTAYDSVSVTVVDDSFDFAIKTDNTQPLNWYKFKDHDNWKPIRVSMTVNGQPLTAEEMERVVLSITPSTDISYRVEADPENSAFLIYVGQNDEGEYAEPQKGKHALKISAVYTDIYGTEHQSKESNESFEVQNYSRFWRWLFWLVLFAVIVFFFLVFMSQKVMPKKIFLEHSTCEMMGADMGNGSCRYNKRGKTLELSSPLGLPPQAVCRASFDLRPVDNRWKPSRRRRVQITAIRNVSMGVESISIDYNPFERNEHGVFAAKSAPDAPISENVLMPTIDISTAQSTLNCTLSQN